MPQVMPNGILCGIPNEIFQRISHEILQGNPLETPQGMKGCLGEL